MRKLKTRYAFQQWQLIEQQQNEAVELEKAAMEREKESMELQKAAVERQKEFMKLHKSAVEKQAAANASIRQLMGTMVNIVQEHEEERARPE